MSETPGKLTDPSENALDHQLDRLPTPQMPGDLAARIVRDVTRLPQVAAEDAGEPAAVIALSSVRPRRRWVAWTGAGMATALAAGLATLMLLPAAAPRQSVGIPPATVAESAPVTTPDTPAQPAPKLAEARPASSPAQPAPATTTPRATSAPSKVEVVESNDSATPAAPPQQTTPTDSIDADDAAELVDGGNLAIPEVTGQAPPAPGWGYAPGSNRSLPAIRQSEDDLGDSAPDPGLDIRRHRGPASPGRRF